MPPVICVVGHSNSGKTTLVEKLLAELKSRGYRVATAKHAQEVQLDRPGSDTWRQMGSGGEVVVLPPEGITALIKPVAASLDEVVRTIGEDFDIILAEGFKGSAAPKIEVQRKETGPLLSDLKGLFAVVSDEQVETKARKFPWGDVEGLADLVEEGFIKPNPEHLSVYVNGNPVVLSSFPREMIRNLMLAMAASLKGGGEAKSLEFRLRKGTDEIRDMK